MRITAPSVLVLVALLFTPTVSSAEADSAYSATIANLASFLSQGDRIGALESFDKQMKDYEAINRDISALTAQAEVLCSIDIVEDKEKDEKEGDSETADVHHLDLDWYMQLKSRGDPNLIERRRQRVAVTLQKIRQKWLISSLAPEQILAPITIR
jgi:hypothetical protein